MIATKEIKTIDNKADNKIQYNLDREAAKISVLSSGNFDRLEFLTSKTVLLETNLL